MPETSAPMRAFGKVFFRTFYLPRERLCYDMLYRLRLAPSAGVAHLQLLDNFSRVARGLPTFAGKLEGRSADVPEQSSRHHSVVLQPGRGHDVLGPSLS